MSGGRPRGKSRLVVGVDLGGSHCTVALVGDRGTVVARRGWLHDPGAGPDAILGRLLSEAKALRDSAPSPPVALGIGLPGRIDAALGICRFSPNLAGWRQVPVASRLSRELGLPVRIDNDVRTAALGEARFGGGVRLKSFLFVAIGTGIGGGLVLDGRLWGGAHGSAGEVGHITIEPDGPLCNCGNRGCLEALASGPAIAAMAAAAMIRHRPTKLTAMAASTGEVTAELVAAAARKGDAVARECYERGARALGMALAGLATALDPERIIVGGGVAQAGAILFVPLERELVSRVRMFPAKTLLAASSLGRDAGLLGAAALAQTIGTGEGP